MQVLSFVPQIVMYNRDLSPKGSQEKCMQTAKHVLFMALATHKLIILYFSYFLSHSYRPQSEFHLPPSAHQLLQKQKGTASSYDLSAGDFGSGFSLDEVCLCRKIVKHHLCQKNLTRLECQILVSALLHLQWLNTCFVVQGSCCSVISSSLNSKSQVILPCAATLFLSFRAL